MTTQHLIGIPYEVEQCVGIARRGAEALGRPIPEEFELVMSAWLEFVEGELQERGRAVELDEAEPGDLVLMGSSAGPAAFHWGVIDEHGRVLHSTRRAGSVAVPMPRVRSHILSVIRF